jgi:hypothetical protein
MKLATKRDWVYNPVPNVSEQLQAMTQLTQCCKNVTDGFAQPVRLIESRTSVLNAAQFGSTFHRSCSSRDRIHLEATSYTMNQTAQLGIEFYSDSKYFNNTHPNNM